MENIKIKTGARISNILQSTVTYPQAFTELVKNSMQNGANNVDITFKNSKIIVQDNGIGFDHEKDANDMNGFEKYFVFGNSYNTGEGTGPALGHMGIGGKVANDKLSDSTNVHWTIETKNKHGKCFLVTYNPGKTEFLDDYSPQIIELEESNISSEHGTIVTINNLDKPIINGKLNILSVKRELRDFFGYIVQSGNTDFNVNFNNESLQFSYTLPGYQFNEINKSFDYEIDGEIKKGSVKFNLSLLQNQNDEQTCTLDSTIIVSDVKICDFTLNNQKIIKKVLEDLSKESEKEIKLSDGVLSLFSRLRGFIVCKELSSVVDHTGMPAKDLSHHALREDHPVTEPFYETSYRVIIDLLRGYLMLDVDAETEKFSVLGNNIVKVILDEMNIDTDLLIDNIETNIESMEERMSNASVAKDIIGNLIKSELREKTKEIKEKEKRDIQKNLLKQTLEKQKEEPELQVPEDTAPANEGEFIEDEEGEETKISETKSIRYEIKPFGEAREKIMSQINDEGDFCIYINSENYKFDALKKSDDVFSLSLHIAECIMKELIKYSNPSSSTEIIDETLSEFYKKSYYDLKETALFR